MYGVGFIGVKEDFFFNSGLRDPNLHGLEGVIPLGDSEYMRYRFVAWFQGLWDPIILSFT